jgi:cytochrome c
MDSFELNKVLGAILSTCLLLVALNIAAGAVFHAEKPAKPGYDIAVQEVPSGGASQAPAPEVPIETLLASADVTRGENGTKPCQACHTFTKGGENRVGPNLWGVVGRPRASEAGFEYSPAMKAKGGTWTYDELNKFLEGPAKYIPGTKMTFGGLTRPAARADVIAYLNSLSDSPKPLPKAAQAAAAAPAAPAAAPNTGNKPH